MAEHADDERMNAGYEALVGILEGDAAASAELQRILDDASAPDASEGAKFYAQQLQTALAIFQRA